MPQKGVVKEATYTKDTLQTLIQLLNWTDVCVVLSVQIQIILQSLRCY